ARGSATARSSRGRCTAPRRCTGAAGGTLVAVVELSEHEIAVFRQLLRMILVRAITYFACLITITYVALPASAFAQDPPDEPPTALEQTLAEHVCDRLPVPPATANRDPLPAQEAREQCAGVQLRALRAEFGYNLGHLSPAERSRLDATCSRLRKPENYEPYLTCLTALLVSVPELRPRTDGL